MKKQQLLNNLEKAWQQFKESYLGLTDSQMSQPGVIGGWSVKDIIAHITTWEEEALKSLPMIMQDHKLPRYKDLYGGLNAFNALMTEKKRGLSLSDVLKQLETTHMKLISFINNAPEELFTTETRFRRRLRLDLIAITPNIPKLSWPGGNFLNKFHASLFSTRE
jgi:hypothetical protein